MDGFASVELGVVGLVDLLGDVGHEGCQQLDRVEEHGVEGVDDSVVGPLLDHLDVVVGEDVPDELLDVLHGLVELVDVEAVAGVLDGLGELADDPPVSGPQVGGPGGCRGQLLEVPGDELSQVVDLDGDLLSADDILLAEGVVDSERAVGCEVPQCVRTVFLEDGYGVDDVSDGGMHGGSVGGHDESVNHYVLPGDAFLDLLRPEDGVECPGPDDIVGLGPHGHGEELLVELGIPLPEGVVKGGSGGVHPGVEHVGASDELGASALGTLVDRSFVLGGVHVVPGLLLGGADGMAALLAFPDGDGGGEDPLPGEDPVPSEGVGPVLETDLHELGIPVDLGGPLEDGVLEGSGLQEPLGDLQELDGGVAPPADGDLLGVVFLMVEDTHGFQVLDDGRARIRDLHACVFAGELGHAAGLVDSLLELEVVLHDPLEVCLVSDGTDHDVSGTVSEFDLGVGDDLDVPSVDGGDEFLADQVGLLLVVGVDGDDFTGAEQLGPGGGDHHVIVGAGDLELEVVELVDVVFVLDLGIGEGGHTSGTPVDGVACLIDESAVEQLDEGKLGDAPVVRGVGLVVDGRIHGLSEDLEVMGHLLDETVGILLAQLPVLLPGGVELVDAVLLLHLDLDGSSVHIETQGEEHIASLHPVIPGGEVDEGISGGVSEMEGTGGVPRGVVDAEDGLVGLGVEAVDCLLLPHVLPAFLYFCAVVCHVKRRSYNGLHKIGCACAHAPPRGHEQGRPDTEKR